VGHTRSQMSSRSAGPRSRLGAPDALSQPLGILAEIGSDVRDRPPALQRESQTALHKVFRILLRSGHTPVASGRGRKYRLECRWWSWGWARRGCVVMARPPCYRVELSEDECGVLGRVARAEKLPF
jgi:hypothetical protein